jgi:hypothetical protein
MRNDQSFAGRFRTTRSAAAMNPVVTITGAYGALAAKPVLFVYIQILNAAILAVRMSLGPSGTNVQQWKSEPKLNLNPGDPTAAP